jgi:K+-sensing histidine kinase KdpD
LAGTGCLPAIKTSREAFRRGELAIDSGEGIAAEALPHIWQRFYRSSQDRTPGRTGIGLSLVKELVETMGETVGVESQPGGRQPVLAPPSANLNNFLIRICDNFATKI